MFKRKLTIEQCEKRAKICWILAGIFFGIAIILKGFLIIAYIIVEGIKWQ